eukprot:gb/GFBE01019355.1/.p1 GENE.gb/GFBE01019355.1/~~gb/GFBE01019355.1/.p1  ORF type:complete len:573 (+),score=89.98 gb/GFBE01019355.1/:1-1719(+)
MSGQEDESNVASAETQPSNELSDQVPGTAGDVNEATTSASNVGADDAGKTDLEKKDDAAMNTCKSPVADKDKLDLAFRMCDVYAAPRLPHALASAWNPILKSAEDLKFGRFKGLEAPGKSKHPDAGKRTEAPPQPELPKRPRVPMAPRRLVPKQKVESEEEGKSAAELDCPSNSSTSQKSQRLPKQKSPLSARKPQQLDLDDGRKSKPEPQLCEWCGVMEPPDHPKHCKLRMVECKHCKLGLTLAALRQHLKTCSERPLAQQELQQKSRSVSKPKDKVAPRSATPVESHNYQLCLDILGSLQTMLHQMHQRLDVAIKRAMLHESGNVTLNADLAEVDNLESNLQTMAQKLAVVELSVSGGMRVYPGDLTPEEMRPSPSEDLLPPSEAPASVVEALQDLQRRLCIFEAMLNEVSEIVGVTEPQKPVPTHAQRSPPTGTRPPGIVDLTTSWQAVDAPRSSRAGKQLPPLNSARGMLSEDGGRLKEQPGERLESRASSRRGQSSRQEVDEEIPPLLKGPGPAAVGYRDIPLEQMRKEVEQERQRYIAQGIKTLARQQPRSSLMRPGPTLPAPGYD